MMAAIPTPTPHHNLTFTSPQFPSLRRPFYPPSRLPDSTLCRCSHNPSDNTNSSSSFNWRWDSAFQQVFKNTIKGFDSYMNSFRKDSAADEDGQSRRLSDKQLDEDDDWDWDRWKKHFEHVDEQERLLSLLKLQLNEAVHREDYEDAARLKVAIAAAATNDAVGRVISHLNRAVVEERYQDAAFLRDNASAGLVGWWAGLSDDTKDPYGLIIRITAEHGRYVARSFSPRQLASASVGVPLFEIFLTVDKKGEYKQQAVYLKKRSVFQDSSLASYKTFGGMSRTGPSDLMEDKSDLFRISSEDDEDANDADADADADADDNDVDDGSDMGDGLTGFQNILRDMIPGVKIKVLKVTAPGKADKDFISKVIEQIIDEEDEEKDDEVESIEVDDEIKSESDQERDQIELDADGGVIDNDRRGEIAIKVVVGGLAQKLSSSVPSTESVRVPAKLVKKGRLTFSFSIEKDTILQHSGLGSRSSLYRKAKIQGQRSADNIMFDLAKFIGKEKIPLKVLKDVGELIDLTLNQAKNHQPLSGSTTFHRIDIAASPDPLNGLYIGAYGLYTSEVIHLRRKFGQWQDSGNKEPSELEFYEYVEAVKLTGDPYVPAGEVAFRARVGKRYQLPHKGIIPEELGVVARYKGQGRLAEPGFRNPRWVDGELVILDGQYIKGGPVVGFMYWAPEYHFLVFFSRLRLQQ